MLVCLCGAVASLTLFCSVLCHFQDIVVRVCYILGNLTAKTDEAREKLFSTFRALETLLAIMRTTLKLAYFSKVLPLLGR